MTISEESNLGGETVQVWDVAVRLFHWSLVLMVALAFVTEDSNTLHLLLGYTVIGLIGFRLVWGMVGTRHARFGDFVTGPRRLLGYLRDMIRGTERRYLGHNPAGAAMILSLFVTLIAVGVTGHMMGMDVYARQDWVENAHEALASILLILIALHVGGVVLSSLRHGENLVASMISGSKRR